MELSEGISIVKPPKRASTFGAKPTLEQLQRTVPQADAEELSIARSSTVRSKEWAVEIWQSPETQRSYTGLKEVVQSYNYEASSEDLVRIQEASIQFSDVRNVALATRERKKREAANSNKFLRKTRSGLDKVCSTINHYCPVVDVLAQAAPEYAQLAWGVLRFLLIMKINSTELKETVMQKLGDIGEQFEVVRCFLGLYPSAAMAKHVCGAYESFTRFLTEAVKYYRENCIRRAFKVITHPYAARFEPIIQAINNHVSKVKEAAAVGQGIAIAENTAITKQTRAMIAAGNWRLDERFNENSQALKGLAAMMEATRQQLEWRNQAEEEAKAIKKPEEFDPFETARNLLSERSFSAVLRIIRPTEIAPSPALIVDDLARLTLTNTTQGADSRVYERLGLLENASIAAWVTSRESKFLWIDGFLARPDWTTQLSLDVITAVKQAGNVALHFMCSEHDESCKLHSPVAWAWNFIEQLVTQRPEYFTFEKQSMIVTSLILAKQDFKAVWQVFASCIRETDFGFIYLVIDNIDIAFGGANPGMPSFLQDLLTGLQALSSVPHRTVKILITARRTALDDFSIPQDMVVVSIAPRVHLSKSRPHHKSITAAVRKPKPRRPDRLPDRETANDVTLSDESSLDDEKLEEMLESTDEEGKKPRRRREKGKSVHEVRATEEADSLDSLDDTDSDHDQKKHKVSIDKPGRLSRNVAPDSESDDSLDSLDSIASLDSLDEALKTSSDEEPPTPLTKQGRSKKFPATSDLKGERQHAPSIGKDPKSKDVKKDASRIAPGLSVSPMASDFDSE